MICEHVCNYPLNDILRSAEPYIKWLQQFLEYCILYIEELVKTKLNVLSRDLSH